jgi:transcriptional regulator with XRE-family HTH domain
MYGFRANGSKAGRMAVTPTGTRRDKLREARLSRGWSQGDVVAQLQNLEVELGGRREAIAADPDLYGKWERGKVAPGVYYASRLCVVFQASPAELDLSSTPRVMAELAEVRERLMKRRTFLGRAATTVGVAALGLDHLASAFDSDRLAAALSAPRKVDPTLVDGLRKLTQAYVHTCDTIPPHRLLSAVTLHLTQIRELISEPSPNPDIADLTTQTAILAGWLSWQLDNRGNARSYWRYAEQLAAQLGASSVHAYAVGVQAELHSHAPYAGPAEDGRAALALLDRAIAIAGKASKPNMHAWLHARRAEQHAMFGNRLASHRDLDHACRIAASGVAAPDALLYMDDTHGRDTRQLRYRASSAHLLGDDTEAIGHLNHYVGSIDPGFLPHRVKALSYLAMAHAGDDIDHACDLLGQSVEISRGAGLREAARYATAARRRMRGQDRHPAVIRLDEQLQELPA